MKVSELIKALKKMPPEARVSIRYLQDSSILQSDARAVAWEFHTEAESNYVVILGEDTTL